MMFAESLWIGNALLELHRADALSPLLNVGSSTKHLREVEQSCIHENIFAPLQKGGASVHHLDIKQAEGVDIVGDLSNPVFLEQLRKSNYKAVLCSNLLEHVVHPEKVCAAITDVVGSGGYIIVTVPNLYPFHGDPIDTKFRPGVADLEALFPGAALVKGEVLVIDNTHLRVLLNDKKQLLITALRSVLPFYKFSSWRKIIADLPNLTKKYRVTCVVLKKR